MDHKGTTRKSTEAARPACLLVGLQTPSLSPEELRSSLIELGRLADTVGWEVIGQLWQKRSSPSPGTVLGEGRLNDLVQLVVESFSGERPIRFVVFDLEISPSQTRNIEALIVEGLERVGIFEYEFQVLDRSSLIIEIFSRHARTREARIQVEMARMRYLGPRLRETGAVRGHDRQGGGIGTKGLGETRLELDRRHIRDRLAELRRELDSLAKEDQARRESRAGVDSVALVGYTNAGKSSLLRALTSEETYVADQLFATLDTLVRVIPGSQPQIVVVDTVGFIQKLPLDLVASFRSTLAEAKSARLLLHVIDAGDPDWRQQMATTLEVLAQIDASHLPIRLVFNKSDLIEVDTRMALAKEFPEAWFVSSFQADQVQQLRNRIEEYFSEKRLLLDLLIPYSDGKALGEIRRVSEVLSEEFLAQGTKIKFSIKPKDWAQICARYPDLNLV
jgi:GTP-binding protein HflX